MKNVSQGLRGTGNAYCSCTFTSFTARALQAVVHCCTRLSVRMINTESQWWIQRWSRWATNYANWRVEKWMLHGVIATQWGIFVWNACCGWLWDVLRSLLLVRWIISKMHWICLDQSLPGATLLPVNADDCAKLLTIHYLTIEALTQLLMTMRRTMIWLSIIQLSMLDLTMGRIRTRRRLSSIHPLSNYQAIQLYNLLDDEEDEK